MHYKRLSFVFSRCKESSESDEESFDANAAFFTKVVNKKKKGHGAEQPQSGKKDKKDRDTNNADDVSMVCLLSRPQGLSRYLETGCPNRGFIDFCVSKVWYKIHTTNKIDPIPLQILLF